MKLKPLLLFLCLMAVGSAKASSDFIPEPELKQGLLQMLARFTTYVKAAYQPVDSASGCFKGENTMGSDERGVRTNADLSMVCAFLCKYARGKVELPVGVSWQAVEEMAMKSLVFAYSTHKANRLMTCRDGRCWGSVSVADHQWESSLWAMSVAYSAFFQWERLSLRQRACIGKLLRAECSYELERSVPTGFRGDTKAEENGWETGLLAATIGLFPADALAPAWYERMQAFAVNSYSHPSDTSALYVGPNLFPDWTLQNHGFFHTSYQNVVIQELGEAALALRLFQWGLHGQERWRRGELLHNCANVTHNVLNWLSLPDGEQAMPNGNDWSLFLYDQITSYSTMACMLQDADALMLENRAFRQIRHRQSTTPDGSWLLRPDVGGRRMGVEAHRVMMSWLMHEYFPTADLQPSSWADFLARHAEARLFPDQQIVRAATKDRFTCFSWSSGKQSYTGYVAPFNLLNNNLIVPFRTGNTGNLLGYYTVAGTKPNARPAGSPTFELQGDSYVMHGALNENDSALNRRFVLWSTPGNAVVYIDDVRANTDARITGERGGLLALSTDEFTRIHRDFYTSFGRQTSDGSAMTVFRSPRPWINVDGALGILGTDSLRMAFGDRAANNSVMTSKLYVFYDDRLRDVRSGSSVGRRQMVLYSQVNSDETALLCDRKVDLRGCLPEGWNGLMVFDLDSVGMLLVSNFRSAVTETTLRIGRTPFGCAVLTVPTRISHDQSTAVMRVSECHSYACGVDVYADGDRLECTRLESGAVRVTNLSSRRQTVTVTVTGRLHQTVRKKVKAGETVTVTLTG